MVLVYWEMVLLIKEFLRSVFKKEGWGRGSRVGLVWGFEKL